MKKIVFFPLILLILSCKSTPHSSKTFGPKNPNAEYTACVLIEKNFVNKGGKISEYKELYLQCSIQDYFIKLCESKVTLKDLKPYINTGIKVKMEIKEGMWDHCNEDPAYAQSRIGNYVIIKEIVK